MNNQLTTYVDYVNKNAQILARDAKVKAASMILRGCDKFLQKLPVEITWRLHFTIKNNLAQLSNQSGEIKQSIKYLKDAIGIAE